MLYCHRSRSRSPLDKRESQHDRDKERLKTASYERYYSDHSIQTNRQHSYRPLTDQTKSIDEIIQNVEQYSPTVQTLVRELLIERKKRQLFEERLTIRENDHAHLCAQHEQLVHSINLLKRDYDQCRNDLKIIVSIRMNSNVITFDYEHILMNL
ncbi:hypothetical protein I4U23_030874 [Adineta vaga]|nr:hypothetical protein I4U23_030874 [Adineta vaga]